MGQDYITDIDEPVIEELDEPVTETLFNHDETVESLLKRFEPQRTYRINFPLDHNVVCEHCSYTGVVGFKQLLCPKCNEHLIRPEDVEGVISYRDKKRG